MATGDIVWFEEATTLGYFAGWAATDVIKAAVLDNTVTPAADDATPALGDYTEVGAAGTYTAGGVTLGNWGDLWAEVDGVGTFDSAVNPSWAKSASNDNDAFWVLLYNDTQAGDPAFAFVDLGGPRDMSAGALSATWNASGIATVTQP